MTSPQVQPSPRRRPLAMSRAEIWEFVRTKLAPHPGLHPSNEPGPADAPEFVVNDPATMVARLVGEPRVEPSELPEGPGAMQVVGLLRLLRWRRALLERVASTVARRQRRFLTGQAPAPASLTLEELAKACDLSPPTVARVLGERRLSCAGHVHALTDLVRSSVPSDAELRVIDEAIARLVTGEDPRHPLSDQALKQRLAEDGVLVSRRVVAKRREAVGIASASRRKRPG